MIEKIKRQENLPPPHWSPTGENGYWVFRDEKWKWYSDEEYKNLNDDMKRWVKETEGRFWIPTIMTLPTGMLYPIDKEVVSENQDMEGITIYENVMKWAYAPMIDIPEEEQKDYSDGNGGVYKQRYDTDNQTIFDQFVDSMLFLTNMGEKYKDGKAQMVQK